MSEKQSDYEKILANIDTNKFSESKMNYVVNVPTVIDDDSDLDELINDDLDPIGGLEFKDIEISLMRNTDGNCFVIVQLIYEYDDESVEVTQCLLAFSPTIDGLLTACLPDVISAIFNDTISVSNLKLRDMIEDAGDGLEEDTDDDDDDDDNDDGKIKEK